jgi:aryl-alcohol dehydrogenase-like predicted oxidoreductase
MAFGEQNAGIESHKQLDNVIIMGINFIDTTKHYSVPGKRETQGSTQRYIGLWLKDRADSVKPNSAS